MADLKFSNSTYQNGTADSQTPLVDGVDQKTAEHINYPVSAVLQVETVLGSAPSLVGAKADLATRLAVGVLPSGQLDRTQLTGILDVAHGGTNLTTVGANTVLYGSSTGVITASATPTLGTGGTSTGKVILANSSNTNTLTLQPGATGSNLTFTLPTADGASGQAITTDGAGNLSLTTVAFDPEGTMVVYEDFVGNPAGLALAGYFLGSYPWGINGTGTMNDAATSTNGVALVAGAGSVSLGGLTANADSAFISSKNPTLKLRWAQAAGAGSGNQGIIGLVDAECQTNANPTNGIYIKNALPSGAMTFVCRKGGTESTLATGASAADGVFHTFRMVVTGGGASVECWIDGVDKGAITTNVPTVALFGHIATGGNGATGYAVDYFYVSQAR